MVGNRVVAQAVGREAGQGSGFCIIGKAIGFVELCLPDVFVEFLPCVAYGKVAVLRKEEVASSIRDFGFGVVDIAQGGVEQLLRDDEEVQSFCFLCFYPQFPCFEVYVLDVDSDGFPNPEA